MITLMSVLLQVNRIRRSAVNAGYNKDRGESFGHALPHSSSDEESLFCMQCWCTLQQFVVYFCHRNTHFQFLASLVQHPLSNVCLCVCNEQCEHSEIGNSFLFFWKEESVETHFMQEMITDNTKEMQVISWRPFLAKKEWTTSWCSLKWIVLNSTLMYPK